jgi:hypothetical protein
MEKPVKQLQLEVYNARAIKKGAAGTGKTDIQRWRRARKSDTKGHESATRLTAAAGWATGPWPSAQKHGRMDGSKTVTTTRTRKAPSACGHS